MSMLAELNRRQVFRVAAAYGVFAWLVLQVADVLFPALRLPDWTITLVAVLLLMGLVPALVLAWVYRLTPEGLQPDSGGPPGSGTARKLDLITIGMLVMLAGVVGLEHWLDRPDPPIPERVADGPERQDEVATASDADSSPDSGALVRIAVLPFDDMSDTQDQEYLGDGIAEELLNRLSRIEDFLVAGRTSSFAFKGRQDDLRAIGERLDVGKVLEGSIRKSGDRLRITAQLVNVSDGFNLWSETYDRRLDDIFAIQDEIAESVVVELQSTLLGRTPSALESTQETDTETFEMVLRARHLLYQRRPETLIQARDLFRQAIARDPGFVPAYSGLSDSLIFSLWQGFETDEAGLVAEADAVLARGLKLAPNDADLMASRGLVRARQNRMDEARETYREAIERNPANALVHSWYGNALLPGEPARALSQHEQAYRIDPLERVVMFNLFYSLERFGRGDEGLELALEARQLYGGESWGHAMLLDHFRYAGERDQSVVHGYRAYRAEPHRSTAYTTLLYLLADLGEFGLAKAWIDEVERNAPGSARSARAYLAVAQGRLDAAADSFAETPGGGIYHLVAGDADAARRDLESRLNESAGTSPVFDPYNGLAYLDYACALEHSGESDSANAILNDALAYFRALGAAGVVHVDPFALDYVLALNLALMGNNEEALEALRRLGPKGPNATDRRFPHFERLWNDPEFNALIEDTTRLADIQRQRLADAGLLLTPAQVRERDPATLALPDTNIR